MQKSVWPVYMCYLCTLESTQSHKANLSRAPPIHRFLINLSAIRKCTIAIIKHEVIINILSPICGIPSIKNEKSSLFTVLWRVRLCWYCDLLLDWSPFYDSNFPFLKTKDVLHILLIFETLITGADTGFPVGGGANPRGRQHTNLPDFPKTAWNYENFGP